METNYLCFVKDNLDNLEVALMLSEDKFIKLMINLDKERYDVSDIHVIQAPVYNDIEFFIKKKPDGLETGQIGDN